MPKSSEKQKGCTLPRVLVVDDEANQARVMAIGLRIEGFEVETAASSAEALERLAAQPFDLAIVDLMMPGTNGIQLARLVRDRHPRTRVVLTSAYHLSERQLVRADCGAVGFVPKPFDLGSSRGFCGASSRASEAPAEFDVPGEGLPGARPRAGCGHRSGAVVAAGACASTPSTTSCPRSSSRSVPPRSGSARG